MAYPYWWGASKFSLFLVKGRHVASIHELPRGGLLGNLASGSAKYERTRAYVGIDVL
jgi:hypothetical protein